MGKSSIVQHFNDMSLAARRTHGSIVFALGRKEVGLLKRSPPSSIRKLSSTKHHLIDMAANSAIATSNGDLNNVSSMRKGQVLMTDHSFAFTSLAIPEETDDAQIRRTYRPFLMNLSKPNTDWVNRLELAKVTQMSHESIESTGERLKILVLYGSLRAR